MTEPPAENASTNSHTIRTVQLEEPDRCRQPRAGRWSEGPPDVFVWRKPVNELAGDEAVMEARD